MIYGYVLIPKTIEARALLKVFFLKKKNRLWRKMFKNSWDGFNMSFMFQSATASLLNKKGLNKDDLIDTIKDSIKSEGLNPDNYTIEVKESE